LAYEENRGNGIVSRTMGGKSGLFVNSRYKTARK